MNARPNQAPVEPRHRLGQLPVALAAALLCGGCMIVPAPSPQELRALDTPSPEVAAKVDRFFPQALDWHEAVEAALLPTGRPLAPAEVQIAQRVGVQDPGRVRVVVLENFPMPTDPALLAQARRHGLGSPHEGGRTQGHVIMLKPWTAEDSMVLAHELVHVAQHERLGRAGFLRRYLIELEVLGYARSPLELEAYAQQGRGRMR